MEYVKLSRYYFAEKSKKKGAENRPQFVKVFLFFRTETQHQSEPEFHQLACQMCEQRWA